MTDDRNRRQQSNEALGEYPPGSAIGSRRLRLSERLALRPKELAAALGIGERTVRALLPEIPHFRVGNVVLIPVKPAERWLAEQVKAQQGQADAVVEEIVQAIRQEDD